MDNSISLQNNEFTVKSMRKSFTLLGFGIVAMNLVIITSQLLILHLIKRFSPELLSHSIIQYLISFISQYVLGFPCLYFFVKKLPKASVPKSKTGLLSFLGILCSCVTLMFVGNLISQFITTFVGMIKGESLQNPVESVLDVNEWWINFLFVAIAAPILEELVFRKFICEKLLPLGKTTAIIISAAIFGLAHGNFFQFFYAFLIGLAFAFVFLKTGKIIYSILIHIFINTFSGVIASEILSNTDMGILSSGGSVIEALLELLPLLLYLGIQYSIIFIGLVVIIFNLRKLRPEPLPEGLSGTDLTVSIFTSAGIISALVFFSFIFLQSLIL